MKKILLCKCLLSAVVFIAAAIYVTDLLQNIIWPSLFIGIPAGLLAAGLVFLFLHAGKD